MAESNLFYIVDNGTLEVGKVPWGNMLEVCKQHRGKRITWCGNLQHLRTELAKVLGHDEERVEITVNAMKATGKERP